MSDEGKVVSKLGRDRASLFGAAVGLEVMQLRGGRSSGARATLEELSTYDCTEY